MHKFCNQSVRDLAWAISSPPLIAGPSALPVGMAVDSSAEQCLDSQWPSRQWYEHIAEESLDWLRQIDNAPEELNALLTRQKDRQLGKYFETLWYFWLNQHPRYDILENNLQIIIDGETGGEMDLIVYDKHLAQTQHWELAVKFYLGVGDTLSMNNWHGPGLRDRLDLKVEHLQQRQSVISKQPRVARWLKQRGLKIDACLIIWKGRLYYPWSQHALEKVISPSVCGINHMRSWWLTQSQFDIEVSDSTQTISLFNRGWLERIPTVCVKEFDTKRSVFKNRSNNLIRYPLHVQLYNVCHSWDRVFLTDDNWPPEKT